MNFAEIVEKMFHAKHYRVKTYVHVAPKYRRDRKGRFLGGLERKGYSRRMFNRKAPKVSNMELMAENITSHNALLAKLRESQ